MRGFAIKALITGLVAGSAIALALPAEAAPHHGHPHRAVVVGHGGRGHVVHFRRFGPGHFNRLSVVERNRWMHGHWWHGPRHGRVGWWWWAGSAWYWYPEAVYPYPTEISDEAVYDYAPEGYTDDSWYYCANPEGYYPYVKSCNGAWKPVPITPQANAGDEGAYGGPPGGDDADDQDDQDDQDMNDQDDQGDDQNGDDQSDQNHPSHY